MAQSRHIMVEPSRAWHTLYSYLEFKAKRLSIHIGGQEEMISPACFCRVRKFKELGTLCC